MSTVMQDHSYGGPSDLKTDELENEESATEHDKISAVQDTERNSNNIPAFNDEDETSISTAADKPEKEEKKLGQSEKKTFVAVSEKEEKDLSASSEKEIAVSKVLSYASEKEIALSKVLSYASEKEIALSQVDLIRKTPEVETSLITRLRTSLRSGGVVSKLNTSLDLPSCNKVSKVAQHSCESTDQIISANSKEISELYTCGVCRKEFPAMCQLHEHMVNEEKVKGYKYSTDDKIAHVDENCDKGKEKLASPDQKILRKRGRKRKTDLESDAVRKHDSSGELIADLKKVTDDKPKAGRKRKRSQDYTDQTNNVSRKFENDDIDLNEQSLVKFEKTMEHKSVESAFFDPVSHSYGTRRRSFLKLKEMSSSPEKEKKSKTILKKGGQVQPCARKGYQKITKHINETLPMERQSLEKSENPKLVKAKDSSEKEIDSTGIQTNEVKVTGNETPTNEMKETGMETQTTEVKVTGNETPTSEVKETGMETQTIKEKKTGLKKETIEVKNTGFETQTVEGKETGNYHLVEVKPDGTVAIIRDHEDSEDEIVESDTDLDYVAEEDEMKEEEETDKEEDNIGESKINKKEHNLYPVDCAICGKAVRKCLMRRHMIKHSTKREYQCNICMKFYKTKSQCEDHKKKIHYCLNKIFKCKICSKSLKNKYNAEKHKLLHLLKGVTPEIEEMDVPNPHFVKEESFQAETETDLKEQDKSNININNKSSDNTDKVGGHGKESGEYQENETNSDEELKNDVDPTVTSKLKPRKEKKHQCNQCQQEFNKLYRLREHVENVHENKKFECDVCKTTLSSYRGMWTHKWRHLSKSDPFYSEEVAAKIREEHREKIKPKITPTHVVCNICGKEVVSKRYVRHMHSHNTARDYECDICHKWFTTKRYVTDHKKKSHGNVTSFCDICGRTFKGISYLEKHKQTHGPRDKICDLCGRGFTTDFYLRTHMFTHADGKQFKCELCEAAFKHKSRLDIHMVERHSKGQDRPCRHCGELFPSRQKARLHERKMHEGFLPARPKRRPSVPKKVIQLGEDGQEVRYTYDNVNGHITLKVEKEEPESVEQIIEIPENSQQCQLMILPNGVIKVLNVIEGTEETVTGDVENNDNITIQYVTEDGNQVTEQEEGEVQYIEMDESAFKLMTEGKGQQQQIVHIVEATE